LGEHVGGIGEELDEGGEVTGSGKSEVNAVRQVTARWCKEEKGEAQRREEGEDGRVGV